MSAEEVAKAFTQHYYQMKDTNVDGLAGLYVSERGDLCVIHLQLGIYAGTFMPISCLIFSLRQYFPRHHSKTAPC